MTDEHSFLPLRLQICYGAAKGTKELHRLIETDAITEYDSPFREWPSSLLADLSDAIYRAAHPRPKGLSLMRYTLRAACKPAPLIRNTEKFKIVVLLFKF